MCTGLWWGNLRERDPGLERRIIVRWIFRKCDWGVWTELIWLRVGTGCCECGNELSGYIKCREFLDQVRTNQLPKNSAPCSKSVHVLQLYI